MTFSSLANKIPLNLYEDTNTINQIVTQGWLFCSTKSLTQNFLKARQLGYQL